MRESGGGLAKSCTTEGSMSGVTSDLAMLGSGWRCCHVTVLVGGGS